MKLFSSAKVTVFLSLTLVLFLTPLYSVYAVGSNDFPASQSGVTRSTARENLKSTPSLNNLKDNFETRVAGMRDKIASREAQFKLRLNKFTDQLKAQIAERVNHNLNLINQNQTRLMNSNLDQMNAILDRVVIKTGTATASAQVTAAKSAITSSHNFVATQALKDYTINISTESGIRKDAQAMREKLHTDLKTTRDSVQAAKQAVLVAIRSLLGESTNSATQSGVMINH